MRSPVADDFSGATCLVSNSTDTFGQDSTPPANILYYLVRVENACGENVGAGSDAVPRNAASCP